MRELLLTAALLHSPPPAPASSTPASAATSTTPPAPTPAKAQKPAVLFVARDEFYAPRGRGGRGLTEVRVALDAGSTRPHLPLWDDLEAVRVEGVAGAVDVEWRVRSSLSVQLDHPAIVWLEAVHGYSPWAPMPKTPAGYVLPPELPKAAVPVVDVDAIAAAAEVAADADCLPTAAERARAQCAPPSSCAALDQLHVRVRQGTKVLGIAVLDIWHEG